VVVRNQPDCEERAEDTNHLKRREVLQSTAENVGVRELLEAGVHFGHQAKRWNPKMKRYIFAQRAGVHIIDLDQTLTLLDKSRAFVRSIAEAGREVLFVGTKKQAQITIAEQAMRSGQPYVAERYIGGMLTNFQTIQPRIEYFKGLAQAVEDTPEEERTGREWFARNREYQKLRRNFAGITEMERLPGAVFIVDPKREELLVKEANRLKIPVVALTDTNCDPDVIDYVIPGNDDAIRSINLIARLMADSILEGKGEDEVQADDRPVPPVVEEARLVEEAPLSEAAEEGGVAEEAPAEAAPPEAAPETAVEPADEAVTEATPADASASDSAEDSPEVSSDAGEPEEPALEEPEAAADGTSNEEAPEAVQDEETEEN
jgi:small subunit ribosomal protein S2